MSEKGAGVAPAIGEPPAKVEGAVADLERLAVVQLRKRLDRERRARLQAESIAERATRGLYRRQEEVRLLERIAAASNEARVVEEALQIAVDEVCRHTRWPVGHALVFGEDAPTDLRSALVWHLDDPVRFDTFRKTTESFTFPRGVGLPGRVLEGGTPVWIVDVLRDPNFPRARLAVDIGVRAAFGFPAMSGDEVVGVLEFFSPEPVAPDAALLELMAHIGQQIGRVIERTRAERLLKRALDAALESSRLKSSFLANMSHEIRTPLNVILGYGSAVADHLVSIGDTSQQPMLDGIENASRRLMQTVQAILDLSRADTGAFEVRPVSIDLAAKLASLEIDFSTACREKGLAFSVAIEARPADVVFDEYCLDGILSAVLSNAVKFTREGEVSVRLEREASGALHLSVADTGVGIDEAFLPRLFEPFSQEDSGDAREFEGSGLGLALARRYAQLNGATLSVESRKGEGSVFHVRFAAPTT